MMLLPIGGCRSKAHGATSSDTSAPAPTAAASKATSLHVDGLTLPIPAGYVPMDASTAAQLETSVASTNPGALMVVAGAQSAEGPEKGMLYVTRVTLRSDQLVMRGKVSERLKQGPGTLEVMLTLSGLHVDEVTSAMGDAWFDVRSTTSEPPNVGDARIWTFTRSYFTRDHSLVELTATCHEHQVEHMCEGFLGKMQLDEPIAAPLDDVLGPPLEPIDMGGFAGGATAAEFFAECEKHGMKRDARSAKIKPGEEDPESTLGCEGKFPSYAYGPMEMVTTRLHEGKTVTFVFRLDVDPDKANRDIAARFPTTLIDRGIRFVHSEAKGGAPMAIGVTRNELDPKKTYLSIVTRLGFDFSVAAHFAKK